MAASATADATCSHTISRRHNTVCDPRVLEQAGTGTSLSQEAMHAAASASWTYGKVVGRGRKHAVQGPAPAILLCNSPALGNEAALDGACQTLVGGCI
jgi:hypothetical protein